MSNIKNSIRRARKGKEMTLEELSVLCCENYQVLANKICRDNMTISNVEKIANAMNCDVVFLDRETGEVY